MVRTLLITVLLGTGVAQAQPAPRGPQGPLPPMLSPEALATVPDLDAAKQVEVRRILLQRRDAHDALRTKEDAERDAARARYRAEHERIDDESSARLRKLLGDDGYRALASWLTPSRGLGPDHPRGPRGGPAPTSSNDPPAAPPLVPDPEDAEPQVRVR